MVLVAQWVAAAPTRALAQPLAAPSHRRILMLLDRPGDPFMGRIRAEIESLGLEVLSRAPAGSLDQDARAEHAVAAIRMLPSRKGVEVWMADETSGRSLLRQLIVDETSGGPDQNLIALQTAELFRTSFFPKSPTKAEVTVTHISAPPPPSPVVPQPPSYETSVQGRFGTLYSAGGVSSWLQVWLSLQLLWARHLGVSLDVAFPVSRGEVSGFEGTSQIRATMVGGSLVARLPAERQHLFLDGGLGAAYVSLSGTGQSRQPPPAGQIASFSRSVSTCLVYLRLDGIWRPVSWLGVGATGILGASTGRVHIDFAGNRAANWGLPVLSGLGLVELAWR